MTSQEKSEGGKLEIYHGLADCIGFKQEMFRSILWMMVKMGKVTKFVILCGRQKCMTP